MTTIRRPHRRALFIAVILFTGAVSVPPAPLGAQETRGVIRTGDRVSIDVFTGGGSRIPELTGEHRVDREGRIYLPFIGNLEIEGRNASEIRALLLRRLAEFYESPVAVVEVELRVNVTGAVNRPGHYFLNPASTILDALSEAGGMLTRGGTFGSNADASSVRLTREATVRTLDLRPGSVTREALVMPIQSGDWIHVPETTRSALRENLQIVSSILSVVATVVVLATR